MQQALQMVRTHFGPQAAVLHTRQLNRGLLGWIVGRPTIEVTAAKEMRVPSRLGPRPEATTLAPHTAESQSVESRIPGAYAARTSVVSPPAAGEVAAGEVAADQRLAERSAPRVADDEPLQQQLRALQCLVERLVDKQAGVSDVPLRHPAFELLNDLDFPAEAVHEIIGHLADTLGDTAESSALSETDRTQGQIFDFLASRLQVGGPIQINEHEGPRVVALVGPTGVGKTTTIAKLAANHHLRERHRVGLITVDTYRIAAVEQLQTYAEIIDLPMEVVATPREMRSAIDKMADMDLILIDTAGRSPQDDIRLHELNAVVHEAEPDEIHLVLSVVAGSRSLHQAVETFRPVGITSVLLTKLDEAPTLGGLWPVFRTGIPLSYITDGQNVPDDIAPIEIESFCHEVLDRTAVSRSASSTGAA